MAGDHPAIGKVAATVADLTGATCAEMMVRAVASSVDGIVMVRAAMVEAVVRAAVPVTIRTVVLAACATSRA